jgi:fructoselysine-6-P-deglycase FrlB-like protein
MNEAWLLIGGALIAGIAGAFGYLIASAIYEARMIHREVDHQQELDDLRAKIQQANANAERLDKNHAAAIANCGATAQAAWEALLAAEKGNFAEALNWHKKIAPEYDALMQLSGNAVMTVVAQTGTTPEVIANIKTRLGERGVLFQYERYQPQQQ